MIPLFAVPDAGRVRALKLWLKVIMGSPKLPNDPAMFSTVTGVVSVFSTFKVSINIELVMTKDTTRTVEVHACCDKDMIISVRIFRDSRPII